MTGEGRDREISELVARAAGEPSAEVRARALAEMSRERPGGARSWPRAAAVAIGVAALVLTCGLTPFRGGDLGGGADWAAEARAAEAAAGGSETAAAPRPAAVNGEEPKAPRLAPYRARAAGFVRERYPDDAEMLMAAGLLTDDEKAAVELARRAVEKGGRPAAWAAYVVLLQRIGPRYAGRVGTGGYDPEDAEGIAMERQRIRESGLPESPSAEEMRPLLEAVRGWQAAEPGNAAPAALEMQWLYALHRDEEALERWKHAASLGGVDSHWLEVAQATARLLSRMGMRETDAISRSWGGGGSFELLSHLRQCARPAKYAGRVAQIEGREKDAIAWWNSTVEVGQHMQESANTMVELLVGLAMASMGGQPTWAWMPDGFTGIPGGPLLGGRLFYGPQHEFYVSQVGEEADRELRDLLVAGKVRTKLMREASEKGIFWGGRGRSLRVMQLGAGALALLVLALVTFLAVGTWRRRAADEATDMGWGWRAAVTALAVALAAAGLAVASAASPPPVFTRAGFAAAGAGLGAAWLAAVLLPLVAARRSRRPGARLRTAWRGNLRETLPLVIAVCGVLTLGLGVAGRMLERRWVQEWFREPPGVEMARMVKAFGPALTDPKAPPDAWRAEHPPEAKR